MPSNTRGIPSVYRAISPLKRVCKWKETAEVSIAFILCGVSTQSRLATVVCSSRFSEMVKAPPRSISKDVYLDLFFLFLLLMETICINNKQCKQSADAVYRRIT